MTKADIINGLIRRIGLKRYLEIGYDQGHNFRQIVCGEKVTVDPDPKSECPELIRMTSDEYFSLLSKRELFDMVFIDGLHHADQVRRDIIHASEHLTEHGVIVLHDMCPPSKEAQLVPRQTKVWTGDCWRAMVGFRKKYPEVLSWVHNHDYGVGVIVPNGKKFSGKFEDKTTTYEEFNANRITLLGIVQD